MNPTEAAELDRQVSYHYDGERAVDSYSGKEDMD
jgi:hypothetical protein